MIPMDAETRAAHAAPARHVAAGEGRGVPFRGVDLAAPGSTDYSAVVEGVKSPDGTLTITRSEVIPASEPVPAPTVDAGPEKKFVQCRNCTQIHVPINAYPCNDCDDGHHQDVIDESPHGDAPDPRDAIESLIHALAMAAWDEGADAGVVWCPDADMTKRGVVPMSQEEGLLHSRAHFAEHGAGSPAAPFSIALHNLRAALSKLEGGR